MTACVLLRKFSMQRNDACRWLIKTHLLQAGVLAFNIFLAHVSQFHHIVNDDIRRFRRRAPKKIDPDG
jgi:hypothetical protein